LEQILQVKDIVAGYSQQDIVLNGVSFSIKKGEKLCIIGPNGAGKTTLLRILFGQSPAILLSGQVIFKNEDITNFPCKERITRGISHLLQGRSVFPLMSVEENLEMGAYLREDKDQVWEDIHRIYNILPILEEKKKEFGGNLSGGQRRMLSLAICLMQRPQLLMLDEPSLGLQPSILDDVYREIERLNKEEDITMLIIEQNAFIGLNESDHALVLAAGKIVYQGLSQEILDNEDVRKVYVGVY
jgi:branched-chain amino acid transport system ATP-binding protein